MSNSPFWPIDRTLSGATTLGHSGSGSNGNEGVLHIPQSITKAASSDSLVSYPGHSLGESYPSAEMQSVYFTAPINWAKNIWVTVISWDVVVVKDLILTGMTWRFSVVEHMILGEHSNHNRISFRFDLVSLLNGISTFMGYLMPKPTF